MLSKIVDLVNELNMKMLLKSHVIVGNNLPINNLCYLREIHEIINTITNEIKTIPAITMASIHIYRNNVKYRSHLISYCVSRGYVSSSLLLPLSNLKSNLDIFYEEFI